MEPQTALKRIVKVVSKTTDKNVLKIVLPISDFRSLPIPGVESARLGVCFIKVKDIPDSLDNFMEINPRVPSRSKKGILAGPVVKGILTTLRESPEDMVLKNQGIYLLVEKADFDKDNKRVSMSFTDPGKHGIINGGHTYAAIREAIETATEDELKELEDAYVRLHIFQGIDEDFVPEIAEGLNRSKQVDDPSLINLQGDFDIIRKAMKNQPGEKAISYHQGDEGEVYISELLVYLALFNQERFTEKKHPNNLYHKQALGLKYFSEDMVNSKKNMEGLITKLPEVLKLADQLRKLTPAAARNNGFQFGRVKIDGGGRAGSSKNKGIFLPFINETVNYRVPNGWIYPMLAAFRANLKRTITGKFEWRVPLEVILPEVIDDLVGVCVVEHRDNNMRPELIGKRESAYAQCYTRMQLYLAKKSLLND